MATPLVPWKEGQDLAAAVNRAVRVPAVPPVLWVAPCLLLVGMAYAWSVDAWAAFALGCVLLGLTVGGLVRLGMVRSRSDEYAAAAALADAWTASMPMQQAWAHLERALDRLVWYEDEDVVHKVAKGLDDKGLPVTEDKHETVREYPEIRLYSLDPANEVRLLVATTSTLVTSSQVESRGADLADFLGLNGWHVEVSPYTVSGYIEIRLARTSGRDWYDN